MTSHAFTLAHENNYGMFKNISGPLYTSKEAKSVRGISEGMLKKVYVGVDGEMWSFGFEQRIGTHVDSFVFTNKRNAPTLILM